MANYRRKAFQFRRTVCVPICLSHEDVVSIAVVVVVVAVVVVVVGGVMCGKRYQRLFLARAIVIYDVRFLGTILQNFLIFLNNKTVINNLRRLQQTIQYK